MLSYRTRERNTKVLSFFTLLCCTVSMAWLLYSCTAKVAPNAFTSALEIAKRNVVRYTTGKSSCSGTIVSSKVIITAAHCVPQPNPMVEALIGEDTLFVMPSMTVVHRNHLPVKPGFVFGYTDVATLRGKFTEESYPEVDTLNGDLFKVDQAMLCGYPMFSDEMRCTLAKRVRNERFGAIFDMVAIPGQSGGAVFDLQGKLIGVIQGVTEDGHTYTGTVSGLLSGDSKL